MNVNNLKPKEDFRFKVQRVLSNKILVTALSILLGLFWFFFIKWTAIVIINAFTGLMRITITREFVMRWPDLRALFTPVNPFVLIAQKQWGWIAFYVLDILMAVVNAVKFGTSMVPSYEPLSDRASEEGHRRWTTKRELWRQYRHILAAEPEEEALQYRAKHILAEKRHPNEPYVPEHPLGDIIGTGGFPIARYNTPPLLKNTLVRGFFWPLRWLSQHIETLGLIGLEWSRKKDEEWKACKKEQFLQKNMTNRK